MQDGEEETGRIGRRDTTRRAEGEVTASISLASRLKLMRASLRSQAEPITPAASKRQHLIGIDTFSLKRDLASLSGRRRGSAMLREPTLHRSRTTNGFRTESENADGIRPLRVLPPPQPRCQTRPEGEYGSWRSYVTDANVSQRYFLHTHTHRGHKSELPTHSSTLLQPSPLTDPRTRSLLIPVAAVAPARSSRRCAAWSAERAGARLESRKSTVKEGRKREREKRAALPAGRRKNTGPVTQASANELPPLKRENVDSRVAQELTRPMRWL